MAGRAAVGGRRSCFAGWGRLVPLRGAAEAWEAPGRASNKAAPGARRVAAAAPGAPGRVGPSLLGAARCRRCVASRPAAVRGSGRSAPEGWKSRGIVAL